tara:strand:- start:11918 stop:13357 length:1440 start_codon:yes stop_codon:yes gene_type:complete
MLKQSFINAVLKFGAHFISLISTILIARLMGPKILGELNFAISLIAVFKAFIINSFSSSNIFLINKNINDEKKSQNALVFLTYVTFIIYAILILSYSFFNFFENNYLLFNVILCITISELLAIKFITFRSYFNAKIKQFKASFPEFILIVITRVFQILAVFICNDLIGLAYAILLATIISLPILKKFSPQIHFFFPSKNFIINFIKKSLHFSTSTLVKLVPQQLDKIILETFVVFSFLGFYTIGQMLGNTIEILSMSIGIILFPHFTKLANNKQIDNAIDLTNNYISLFFNGFAFILFSVSFYLPDLIVFILGQDYYLSTYIILVYILIGIVSILLMPFNNICLGFGNLKKISIVNLISFLLFLLSPLFLMQFDFNQLNSIFLMSVFRLIPYLFLLVFFIKYSSVLLQFKFNKILILFLLHVAVYTLACYFIYVLDLNKFIITIGFVFIYLLLNYSFGYNLLHTYTFLKTKFLDWKKSD